MVREFPDAALAVVESLWKPERAKLPHSAEHLQWDWIRKIGMPVFEFIAVGANSQVEGLAAIARSPVKSLVTPEAVLTSLDGGLGGRVQMSELPQAEPFYRKRGMTELGRSASSPLVYFEYTEAQAKAFLTSRGVSV